MQSAHRPRIAARTARAVDRSPRCATNVCPRRHLRVLPIRTRPSLFGGD